MEPDRIWRDGATDQELETVRRMDRELADLASHRATIVNQRMRITNRACQRARYRAMKTAALERRAT